MLKICIVTRREGSYKFLVCWLHKYFIQCMQKVTIFDHNRRLFFREFEGLLCQIYVWPNLNSINTDNTYLFLFLSSLNCQRFLPSYFSQRMNEYKWKWQNTTDITYNYIHTYYLYFKAKIFNVIVSKKCKMLPPILINFSSGFVFT